MRRALRSCTSDGMALVSGETVAPATAFAHGDVAARTTSAAARRGVGPAGRRDLAARGRAVGGHAGRAGPTGHMRHRTGLDRPISSNRYAGSDYAVGWDSTHASPTNRI